jgi:HlyD family secretion protein
VENGLITFDVEVEEKKSPVLRHNLRVEVYVITERAEDALRIRRASYVTVEGSPAVFVIRGDTAVRTPVRFGITNIDHYQVLEGLSEGDEVIISDMSDSMHVREVRLR